MLLYRTSILPTTASGCNTTRGRAEIALNVGWIRALRKHVIVFCAAKTAARNARRRSRSPLPRLLEERLFFGCLGADGRRCDDGFEAAFPCAVEAVVLCACLKPSIFMLKAGRVGFLMAPSLRCWAISEASIWSIMQIRSLTPIFAPSASSIRDRSPSRNSMMLLACVKELLPA